MVARCDDICTACEQMLGRVGMNTVALSRVFTVYDTKVYCVEFLELWQSTAQKFASVIAHNISDCKNSH